MVKFHASLVVVGGRDERRRGGAEGEAWSDGLRLLSRRRVGRVAG